MQEQSFWSEIKFDEDDFQSFREGRLSPQLTEKIWHRRRQVSKFEMGCGLPLFFALSIPFILFFGGIWIFVYRRGGDHFFAFSLITGIFLVVGAALALFVFRRISRLKRNFDLDLKIGRVSNTNGRAKVIHETNSPIKKYLVINKLWLHADWFGDFSINEEQNYRVYYLPESKILLGFENL